MNNIQLTAAQKNEILSLFQQHIPNTEVWAYGSRVAGGAQRSSDLDLVVFSSPEQEEALANLKESLEESYLPFRVDLFSWEVLPRKFQENIKKEHVVLT